MQLWKLNRRIHVSWIIAAASLGIVVGTALVPSLASTIFATHGFMLSGLLLLAIALWKRVRYGVASRRNDWRVARLDTTI